jgi:uncharacterized protein
MQEKIDTMTIETQNTGLNSLLTAEPVQTTERIEVLDVIRGFALLGVLMANMAWFSTPALYFEMLGKNISTGIWDTTTSSFVNLFVYGKFYSMFSFLFGLGFAIFFERAKERTSRPKLLFYRRLFILLLIGLAHAFFVWYGDILVTYALLGFLLPLFFNRKPKTLIKWAVWLFSVFLLFLAIVMGFLSLGKIFNEAAVTESLQPFYANIGNMIESSYQAYGQGNFSEIMTQRTSDTLFVYSGLYATIFVIFPLFLFGLYAGKKKFFQNIETNLPLIRKIWKWSLVIGLTMSVVKFVFKYQMGADYLSFNTAIFTGAGFLGDTGLCLFFMTSIVLLYQNRKWILKLNWLFCSNNWFKPDFKWSSFSCLFYSTYYTTSDNN